MLSLQVLLLVPLNKKCSGCAYTRKSERENSSFSFESCVNCEVAMKAKHALHIYKLMISAVLIWNVVLMSLKKITVVAVNCFN